MLYAGHNQFSFFQNQIYLIFLDTSILYIHIFIIQINNCRGDLSDISAKTATLVVGLSLEVCTWHSILLCMLLAPLGFISHLVTAAIQRFQKKRRENQAAPQTGSEAETGASANDDTHGDGGSSGSGMHMTPNDVDGYLAEGGGQVLPLFLLLLLL